MHNFSSCLILLKIPFQSTLINHLSNSPGQCFLFIAEYNAQSKSILHFYILIFPSQFLTPLQINWNPHRSCLCSLLHEDSFPCSLTNRPFTQCSWDAIFSSRLFIKVRLHQMLLFFNFEMISFHWTLFTVPMLHFASFSDDLQN